MFKQVCDEKDINNRTVCFPEPIDPETETPKVLYDTDNICPDFTGKEACCNPIQTKILSINFNSIDNVFGSLFGGCDICAINLKRFWCHFTCSPNQHEFSKIFK
jgi:hypothetical protein